MEGLFQGLQIQSGVVDDEGMGQRRPLFPLVVRQEGQSNAPLLRQPGQLLVRLIRLQPQQEVQPRIFPLNLGPAA